MGVLGGGGFSQPATLAMQVHLLPPLPAPASHLQLLSVKAGQAARPRCVHRSAVQQRREVGVALAVDVLRSRQRQALATPAGLHRGGPQAQGQLGLGQPAGGWCRGARGEIAKGGKSVEGECILGSSNLSSYQPPLPATSKTDR